MRNEKGPRSEDRIYAIVREALSECNGIGHVSLIERMEQSDEIASAAAMAIVAALAQDAEYDRLHPATPPS